MTWLPDHGGKALRITLSAHRATRGEEAAPI